MGKEPNKSFLHTNIDILILPPIGILGMIKAVMGFKTGVLIWDIAHYNGTTAIVGNIFIMMFAVTCFLAGVLTKIRNKNKIIYPLYAVTFLLGLVTFFMMVQGHWGAILP